MLFVSVYIHMDMRLLYCKYVGERFFDFCFAHTEQIVHGIALGCLVGEGVGQRKKTLSDVFAIEQAHIHVDIDGDKKQLSVTFLCEVEETGVRRYLKKTVGEEWEVKINGR